MNWLVGATNSKSPDVRSSKTSVKPRSKSHVSSPVMGYDASILYTTMNGISKTRRASRGSTSGKSISKVPTSGAGKTSIRPCSKVQVAAIRSPSSCLSKQRKDHPRLALRLSHEARRAHYERACTQNELLDNPRHLVRRSPGQQK